MRTGHPGDESVSSWREMLHCEQEGREGRSRGKQQMDEERSALYDPYLHAGRPHSLASDSAELTELGKRSFI